MGNSKKHRAYVTCSCGQQLYSSIKDSHKQSTRHRYGQKIVELLESGSTLLEVGNALGVTRERVRQIAKIYGVKSASARVRERREQKAAERLIDHLASSRLGRLLEAAAKQGCTNQLVPVESKRNGGYYRERAWINGKLVAVRATWARSSVYGHGVVSIKNPEVAFMDYVAYELPDGRWLFLKPRNLGTHTMFAIHEVEAGAKGYTYTKRHDFREGIEAWHLFRANGHE